MYATHPDFQKLAGRMFMCALSLGFSWGKDSKDENALTLKLRVAHFCRVRLCLTCQWRRCLMWLARFYGALPRVHAKYPTARFIFLTLTQRNVPVGDLRQTLRLMNKAWERMAQRKGFKIVLGWVRATEVTRGADGSAHPHFHVVLMVPSNYFTKNFLKQAQWAEMWREASRLDYTPVVDVRRADRSSDKRGGIHAAVRETLKYAVKPADLKADASWLFEITIQMRNLRFIASGGVLKNILRADDETEKDLLLLRDAGPSDEKASVFFGWHGKRKRYKRGDPCFA